jgi:propanol-preferring alcohol dehydrogenase
MVLNKLCRLEENNTPLEFTNLPDPVPAEKEVLVRLSACGVCHTELDEIEGRTPPSRFPVVLGHEAVGVVEETGSKSSIFKLGDRVGIAWIYSSCRKCKFCLQGNENLCSNFKAPAGMPMAGTHSI